MITRIKKTATFGFLVLFSTISGFFAIKTDKGAGDSGNTFVEKAFADVAGEYDPGCCGSSGCSGCGSSSE